MVTPVLGADELTDGQGSPHATVNAALRQIEGLTIRVLSRTTSAQPGSPAEGDSYIMPASPTGAAWGSYAQHDIAVFIGGAWSNFTPKEGWNSIWVNDTDEKVDFDGASWAAAAVGAASGVSAARIAGSTYSTVQDLIDIVHSVGVTTGGGITDDTDGTITVAAGTGFIRATDSDVAQLLFTDWAAEAGANVALTDNDLSYIYIEYNAGSPQAIATTTKRTDYNTNIFLGSVYRSGTTLHITAQSHTLVVDHAAKMIRRMLEIAPFAHVSGAALSETGTRNIGISAGSFWHGLESVSTGAIDTSVADNFIYYYQDGVGGFTAVTAQTQIDNDKYDDGSGTLASLGTSKYGVHWVFIALDGDTYVVYGRGSYSLADADAAEVPANLPPHFEDHARLVGKIVIQKTASTFADVLSAFTDVFVGGAPTDHADLTNIGTNTHAQLDAHLAELETVSGDNPHGIPLAKHNATAAPGVSDDNTAGYGVGSEWDDVTADKSYRCLDASTGAAVWVEVTAGAGGGEANTASNVGTGGVGVFKQKTGVDLEFKKINAGSSKISITDDTGNSEVDIDVVEANLTITESQISDLDHTDADAIHDNVAGEISAVTEKTSTVAADLLLIEDSAAANAKKRVKIENIIPPSSLSAADMGADMTFPFSLGGGALTAHKNLVIKNNATTPNSQMDIDADWVVCLNSANSHVNLNAVNLTVDITASGANGLDTGTEASSTWYHLWVIFNGTTTAGLISLSSTAPTMPSGYTYKGYVGALKNDASSNFLTMHQIDRFCYTPTTAMLAAGAATTYTSVALNAPSTAKAFLLEAASRATSNGAQSISVAADSAGAAFVAHEQVQISQSASAERGGGQIRVPQLTTRTVWYKLFVAGTGDIDSVGWEF